MSRQLLVFGTKTFKITIPDDAKVTFGPFSPPTKNVGDWAQSGRAAGTLRIYQGTKDNIIGCFTNVTGFRDSEMEYMEEVVREEGATIWKSDEHGYMRDDKRKGEKVWVAPALPAAEEAASEEEIF